MKYRRIPDENQVPGKYFRLAGIEYAFLRGEL
jgi:hypothetical protein